MTGQTERPHPGRPHTRLEDDGRAPGAGGLQAKPVAPAAGAHGSTSPQQAPGGPLVLTVPEAFVWAALSLGLPAVAALLIQAAPRLASGLATTAPVFALTHAATLGWGSLTAMGAAYQMSQTLLGRRLGGERWIGWQLGAFALGSALLVGGFHRSDWRLLASGGTLVTASAWLFFVLIWRTARQLRRERLAATPPADLPDAALRRRAPGGRDTARYVHGLAMAVATTCFALVTAWGLLLAFSLRYPFWPGLHVQYRGLIVHAALGLVGWFGLLVVGVSYRLVPLVHGVREASERRGLAVVGLLVAALAAAVTGALASALWLVRLGAALLLPALTLYAVEVHHLLSRRRRRTPDLNVDHWWAVLAYGFALGLLAMAWALGWPLPRQAAAAAGVLALGGWVTQAILGQLYKVTPFLMWHYRAFIPDVLAIANLPRLYAPRAGRFGLWATNLGTALVATGIWLRAPAPAVIGAWAFAAGSVAVSWLLGYSWIPAVLLGRLRLGIRWGRARQGR